MSSNNWLHCNRCYIRYVNHQQFVLAHCGHVLCSNCASRFAQDGKCAFCKASTSYSQLNKDLKHELLQYFSPLEQTLKNFEKIVDFQEKNKDRLIKHLVEKLNKVKQDYIQVAQMYKQMKKELDHKTQLLAAMTKKKPPFHNEMTNASSMNFPMSFNSTSSVTGMESASGLNGGNRRQMPSNFNMNMRPGAQHNRNSTSSSIRTLSDMFSRKF